MHHFSAINSKSFTWRSSCASSSPRRGPMRRWIARAGRHLGYSAQSAGSFCRHHHYRPRPLMNDIFRTHAHEHKHGMRIHMSQNCDGVSRLPEHIWTGGKPTRTPTPRDFVRIGDSAQICSPLTQEFSSDQCIYDPGTVILAPKLHFIIAFAATGHEIKRVFQT